ncbi:MAG: hypothetical protein K0S47_3179 [Herbinix sp.]|jgi:predicted RNA-binding Zn-ribbon protein involved in translation (DUF1610 family)|nr:hypothetical protein [Herbinix sp.]
MNDIEKAIKELEIQTRATTCTVSIKSCCLAIQALEKQIPKKPINENDEFSIFDCPSCGKTIVYLDDKTVHKHCLICGQAIDWSVEYE